MIILTGGTIALSGIFASSYMKSLNAFIVLYGGLSGIGSGMMYFVPLVCGWEWFPKRRGLVTGIIVGSYGLGSFIFTQIAT
jgi:OFA family oxalate/formate antiporter-like MFS transporter